MSLPELQNLISQHQDLLLMLALASLLVFFGTLVTIPWLVVRLPADYFAHRERASAFWKRRHPVIRLLLLVLKNLLGGVLLLLGILLLVLPGQGLLTMLVGFMLLDFPGKFRVERWLAMRPAVLRSLNWLRRRRQRPPLRFDP